MATLRWKSIERPGGSVIDLEARAAKGKSSGCERDVDNARVNANPTLKRWFRYDGPAFLLSGE